MLTLMWSHVYEEAGNTWHDGPMRELCLQKDGATVSVVARLWMDGYYHIIAQPRTGFPEHKLGKVIPCSTTFLNAAQGLNELRDTLLEMLVEA